MGLLFAGSPQVTILNQIQHVRSLLRVEIDDEDRPGTTKLVDQLMGNKPDARFKFIQERAAFAEADALDI